MNRPQPRRSRGHGRRLAVVVPVVLACAAAVTVGAAAYSRAGAHDNAATTAATTAVTPEATGAAAVASPPPLSDDAHIPQDEVDVIGAPATGDAPAPRANEKAESVSLVPDADGAYKEIKIEIGKLGVAFDDTGIEHTSLPLKVTNTGSKVRSFDITVAAKDDEGEAVTEDTGTAANLLPGQSADVRVLDLVNNDMAEKLKDATFAVTDVFAY